MQRDWFQIEIRFDVVGNKFIRADIDNRGANVLHIRNVDTFDAVGVNFRDAFRSSSVDTRRTSRKSVISISGVEEQRIAPDITVLVEVAERLFTDFGRIEEEAVIKR